MLGPLRMFTASNAIPVGSPGAGVGGTWVGGSGGEEITGTLPVLVVVTKSAETQPVPLPITVVGTRTAHQPPSALLPITSPVAPVGATKSTGKDVLGPLRTFTAIVLPVSRNAVVTVSLFAFLWSWSDFVLASTLDGGGALRPITLGIYQYIGNNNQDWNAIMATAVVASVPAAALLVAAQRFVATGVTAGAVKD